MAPPSACRTLRRKERKMVTVMAFLVVQLLALGVLAVALQGG